MASAAVVFFMGPPGSGKGTQATAAAERLGATVVATSQVLAEMFAENAPGADRIQASLDRGVLAPPALFADALLRVVGRALDAGTAVFIDGSPRTLREAEMLIGALERQGVSWQTVVLDVPKPITVDRVLQRWVCERCRATLSALQPPAACPKCGGPLGRRPDDTADTIERRWEQFTFRTAPVLEWMKRRGTVTVVNGNRPIPDVVAEVSEHLGALHPRA
jgi:adenylate kinase